MPDEAQASFIKQVMRGHNIVADGWAGASNPHPHPNIHHTQKVSKTLFFHFVIPNQRPDRQNEFRNFSRVLHPALSIRRLVAFWRLRTIFAVQMPHAHLLLPLPTPTRLGSGLVIYQIRCRLRKNQAISRLSVCDISYNMANPSCCLWLA